MKKRSLWGTRFASCSTMLLLAGMAHAQTTPDDAPTPAQLESLQKEIAERAKQLEAMKRVLTERADTIRELRNTVDNEMLAHKRGGQAEVGAGATPGNSATGAGAAAAASSATQINSTAQAQQTPSETPPQAVAPQNTQQGQAAQGEQQGEQQGESAAGAEQPVGNPPERDTRPLLTAVASNGAQYVDAANTQQVPSWTRWDLGMRYRVSGTRYPATVRLAVRNVLGRRGWAAVDAYGGLAQADPRVALVSVTASF